MTNYDDKVWSILHKNIFLQARNIFLTAIGGAGKTYWLNRIKYELLTRNINLEICSTTGSSSILLNGKTIHSFAGLGIGDKSADEIVSKLTKWHPVTKGILKCQFLIIDEISMLGAKTLELLNDVLKRVRNSQQVMGGLQCVFCGDFLQLQPVNEKFAFESDVWSQMKFKTIKLTKPFRFTDQRYCELLSRCRIGELTKDDKQLLLDRTCSHEKLVEDIDKSDVKILPTIMFPFKADCDKMNVQKLKELTGSLHVYKAVESTIWKQKTQSEFAMQNLQRQADRMIGRTLPLKVGCQVMLVVNMMDSNLVNGSRGVIVECFENSVDVLFKDSEQKINISQKEFSTDSSAAVLIRKQIPLIIAYAVSINKMQGFSCDSVFINLKKVFTSAMSYVALSRIRNFDSLYLEDIDFDKIYADPKALNFEKNNTDMETIFDN